MDLLDRVMASRPPGPLIERAAAYTRGLGCPVRPALYHLSIPELNNAPTSWLQTSTRLQRAQGPFVICGLMDRCVSTDSQGEATARLAVGERRYLAEVDLFSVASPVEDPGFPIPRRIDWGRPIVCGAGEVISLELQLDDVLTPVESVGGELTVCGFHTDERGADALLQQGELFAHTLRCVVTAQVPIAVAEYAASETIDLDAILQGSTRTTNASSEAADVTSLEIQVGDVRLTPKGLTRNVLALGTDDDTWSSLAGLELRAGELLTITMEALDPMVQQFTVLGRRRRA